MESSIGSSSLDTAGGIAGSKSPMNSRGTVHIVCGGGSPPKPAGERVGGDLKTISKVFSATSMFVCKPLHVHCCPVSLLNKCLC